MFGGMLHKIKENRTLVNRIMIGIFSIILSINMFHKYTDIYLDDGSQHLLRAYGTYESFFQNGNGRIISNFVNGFGYSWDFFYGSLSTYLIIFLGVLVHSFNLGFKIMLLFLFFLAGISMDKFIYEMTENKDTSLLTSIIYMTTPYFFTDVYVRHAVCEAMAFIFLPMVFLGLYNLLNTEKNHYYFIFGVNRTHFNT